jgi:hypothetical protein
LKRARGLNAARWLIVVVAVAAAAVLPQELYGSALPGRVGAWVVGLVSWACGAWALAGIPLATPMREVTLTRPRAAVIMLIVVATGFALYRHVRGM